MTPAISKLVKEIKPSATLSLKEEVGHSHVAPGLQEKAAARFDEGVLSKREKEAVEDVG